MAVRSVIDFPAVTTLLATDVLYNVRGTANDRDKKITISDFFGSIPSKVVVNLAAGSTGNILDLKVNGTSLVTVDVNGQVVSTRSGGGGASAFLANAATPSYAWSNPAQATDEKMWDITVAGKELRFRTVNDANTASVVWMTVTRGTGTAVASVTVAPLLLMTGGAQAQKSFSVIGDTDTTWMTFRGVATANNAYVGGWNIQGKTTNASIANGLGIMARYQALNASDVAVGLGRFGAIYNSAGSYFLWLNSGDAETMRLGTALQVSVPVTASAGVSAPVSGLGAAAGFVVASANPAYAWNENDQASVDERWWDVWAGAKVLRFRTLNGDNTSAFEYMYVNRGTGTAVTSVSINTALTVTGTGTVVGAVTLGNGTQTDAQQITFNPATAGYGRLRMSATTGQLNLTGGTDSAANGATIALVGTTRATTPGYLDLYAGRAAGALVRIYGGNASASTLAMTVYDSGTIGVNTGYKTQITNIAGTFDLTLDGDTHLWIFTGTINTAVTRIVRLPSAAGRTGKVVHLINRGTSTISGYIEVGNVLDTAELYPPAAAGVDTVSFISDGTDWRSLYTRTR